MLFIYSNGQYRSVALATNHSISFTSNAVEYICKDYAFNRNDLTNLQWEITSDNLYSEAVAELFDHYTGSKELLVQFGVKEQDERDEINTDSINDSWAIDLNKCVFMGKALLTSLNMTANDGDMATFSVTLSGTGELRKVDIDSVKNVQYTSTDNMPINIYNGVWGDSYIVYNEDGVIAFDKDIKTVGNRALEGAFTLASITLPEGIERIEQDAFKVCSNLSSVTLPSTLKHIGIDAFHKDIALTSIDLPEGLEGIGAGAFYGSALSAVTTPSTLKEISTNAFFESDLASADLSASEDLTSLTISSFSECHSLTSVVLPDTLEYIDHYTFTNDGFLSSVNFPDTLNHIGMHAFEGTAIEYVDLSDTNVNMIQHSSFKDCTSLTAVTLPDSIQVISDWAFAGCIHLNEINFDGTVAQCAAMNFGENWNSGTLLTKITCSDGDYEIPNQPPFDEIWYTSTDGEVVNIGRMDLSDLTVISNTYEDGKGVIKFDGIVEKLHQMAYSYETRLKTITLPNSVRVLNTSALANCTALTSIELPYSVHTFDLSVFSGTPLTSITLSDNVKKLGSNSFSGTELEYFRIGTGLKEIGATVFKNAPLTEIYYDGEMNWWNNAITKAGSWLNGSNIQVVHCSDGDINIE